MIWIILIIITAIILFRFISDLNKDNYDVHSQTLAEKFQIIVDIFNQYCFNGQGQITELNKKSLNLYKSGDNQIIYFEYSTGHLTITWKYKYFQKEIIHKKVFPNVRNLSIFEQQKIAEIMISEMVIVVDNHQKSVLDNIK